MIREQALVVISFDTLRKEHSIRAGEVAMFWKNRAEIC